MYGNCCYSVEVMIEPPQDTKQGTTNDRSKIFFISAINIETTISARWKV